MLPLKNRLRKTKDFEKVFKQGFFVSDKFIAFKVTPNGLSTSRIGFIVSTKISKKAVVRNKIKRRLRAIFTAYLPAMKAGFDIAVMVKPEIISADFDEIENMVKVLLGKGKLTNTN